MRYPLFMALERDPHRNREHHLVRATEDVQVAALEVHREAAEWQIVSEAGIEAEVPLAIRVSEEGVHVVGAVVTDATRDIQAAIGRRRAEVVLTINRDAEDSVLRARVTGVVAPRQLGETAFGAEAQRRQRLMDAECDRNLVSRARDVPEIAYRHDKTCVRADRILRP